MINKIFSILVFSFFAIAGVANAGDGKIYVCHVTSSGTNPVVQIYVSASSLPAHLDSGDYLIPEGQTSCTDTTPPPTPE